MLCVLATVCYCMLRFVLYGLGTISRFRVQTRPGSQSVGTNDCSQKLAIDSHFGLNLSKLTVIFVMASGFHSYKLHIQQVQTSRVPTSGAIWPQIIFKKYSQYPVKIEQGIVQAFWFTFAANTGIQKSFFNVQGSDSFIPFELTSTTHHVLYQG